MLGGKKPGRLALELTKLSPVKVFLRAVKEKYVRKKGMPSRERVARAIEFKGPDKAPHQKRDFWFLFHVPPMSWQPPAGRYPYVHPAVVATRAWRWKARKDTSWLKQDREAVDEFGTLWRTSGRTTLGEVVKGPLQDGWEALDDYRLPEMKDFSRFEPSARLSKWLEGDRYRLGVDTNSIWERFHFLRGFENACTDLVYHPAEVKKLLDMLTNMQLDIVDNFKRAGAHGYMLVDDWGSQDSSFISPRHFREFFFDCYRRVAERCHELGMHCGIHSCGDIRPVVPLLIEAGLDFIQLDSPNMCGVDWLSENAAGKVCLFCSVDIQEVYPSNDPVRIEAYVKELVEKLGGHNGGLVGWPYAEAWVIEVGPGAVRLEERLWEMYGRYD